MPKPRSKGSASKATTSSTPAVPLLDSIRAKLQPSVPRTDTTDDSKGSTFDWQCNTEDWSEKNTSNHEATKFPSSLRSLERKNEQARDRLFPLSQAIFAQEENKEHLISETIDIVQLNSIVTDLISGKHDQSAYIDFLAILRRFSVHSSRSDNLEETIYHLIQAAVSFIRSNEQRFDPSKLEECYRQRHLLKSSSSQ